MPARNLRLLAVLALFFPGDALSLEVHSFELPELMIRGPKTVALLEFTGTGRHLTTSFADYLREEVGKKIEDSGAPWPNIRRIRIVERERLDEVMKEHGLCRTDLCDDTQMRALGKLLQAGAIITGTVDDVGPSSDKRTSVSSIRCVERAVNLKFSMRVIDIETGDAQIRSVSPAKSDYQCEDSIPRLKQREELYAECMKEAAPQLAAMLRPRVSSARKELKTVKNEEKDIAKKAKKAEELADSGDVDAGYAEYLALAEADPYNATVHYNLGLLEEVVGNLSEAEMRYSEALKLRPDSSGFREAADRVASTAKALAKWGVEPQTYVWKQKEARGSHAEVAGKSANRSKVFEEPSGSAKVLASIPGGLRVRVLGEERGFSKILLPDGTEGWIKTEELKK